MVKPRRRSTSTSSNNRINPEFFKVYIPNQSFKQLRIPPAFVKYLDDELYQNYTLVSLENSAWSVNLEEENDDLFFNKGWNDLVEDYSLEFGDILIFSYLGAAQFSFKVFGQHCCLKNDPFMNMNNPKNDYPELHKGTERQVKGVERREYLEVIDVDDDDTSDNETRLSNHGTHRQTAREFRQRKCKNSSPEIPTTVAGY